MLKECMYAKPVSIHSRSGSREPPGEFNDDDDDGDDCDDYCDDDCDDD